MQATQISQISIVDILTPYLDRADELEPIMPQAAFFLVKFVLHRLNDLRSSSQESEEVAALFLQQLQRAERLVSYVNKSSGREDYINFCTAVFNKAQEEDICGSPDPFHFLVAGLLFDSLEQFGPLPCDLDRKRNYSKWKTTELRRITTNSSKDLEAKPPCQGLCEEKKLSDNNNSIVVKNPRTSETSSSVLIPSFTKYTSLPEIISASTRHVEHGLAALSFKDIPNAIKHLSQALDLLKRENRQDENIENLLECKSSL